MSSPIKAVFYDVDGTIALTEGRNQQVIGGIARRYGADITPQAWEQLGGQPETVVWDYLAPRYPAFAEAINAADFMALCRAEAAKSSFNIAARPGIIDTLAYFKAQGIQIAAVSNAPTAEMQRNLQATGAARFMQFIISETDVLAAGHKVKPAPDPYLMAAARLGLDPTACLVIEDSLAGVRSAKTAGMKVIQVVDHGFPAQRLADAYAHNRDELRAICRRFVPPAGLQAVPRSAEPKPSGP